MMTILTRLTTRQRVAVATAVAVVVAGAVVAGIRVLAPSAPSTAYSFNWSGTPTAPLSVVPATWDTQIHQRGFGASFSGDGTYPMQAQHGPDCSAPPATHLITTLAQSVFICKDHLMTAINGTDYGEIALTSDHMADWSTGTTAITIQISTQQFNPSDFVEVWVTPFADNHSLPFGDNVLDLQGPPKNALVFSFNSSELFATNAGDVSRVDNFNVTSLPKARGDALSSITAVSATVRTTYEMDISAGHIRFGLPQFNVWWTDTNIATLPYTQGVVTLTHHSYNPEKHNPGTGVDTWHWSNFAISNAVPFTILNGAERSVHAGISTVHFPAPAPANSWLRFSGVGPQGRTYSVSYDGGASWASPALQSQTGTHDEHFSTYWTPVPAGTQAVMFRGNDWWGGPWWVRDPAIWSLTAGPQPSPVTSPTPSPLPSPSLIPSPSPSPSILPSPSPTPNACTLTFGSARAGTCVQNADGTVTFTPSLPTPSPTPPPSPSPLPSISPPPQPTPLAVGHVGQWFLYGTNMPWLSWSSDFGGGPCCGPSVSNNLVTVDAKLAAAQSAGMHMIRWWVFEGGSQNILRDASGTPIGLNPAIYTDFDAALAEAAKFGVSYDFVLFGSTNEDAVTHSWWENSAKRLALANVLSPLFAHYASNPRVHTWEIVNEPEYQIGSATTLAGATATVDALANAVHANSKAYVTVGEARIQDMAIWVGHPLDYHSPHYYDNFGTGSNDPFVTKVASPDGKPVVIGEFQASSALSPSAQLRWQALYNNGYAGGWNWSLSPENTADKIATDLVAAAAFAQGKLDTGPR